MYSIPQYILDEAERIYAYLRIPQNGRPSITLTFGDSGSTYCNSRNLITLEMMTSKDWQTSLAHEIRHHYQWRVGWLKDFQRWIFSHKSSRIWKGRKIDLDATEHYSDWPEERDAIEFEVRWARLNGYPFTKTDNRMKKSA